MREYSFVQTANGIYRVFGRSHPSAGALMLIRYFARLGSWSKPPVYGAESRRNSVLERYDLPLLDIPKYAMTLGFGPIAKETYIRYYDPLDPGSEPDLSRFADAAQVPVGLTGSRLVGLASHDSDLDLVVFGGNPSVVGRNLLSSLAHSIDVPLAPSLAFSKFLKVLERPCRDLRERNIFTGRVDWQGQELKVDLTFARSILDIQQGGLEVRSIIGSRRLKDIVIDDVSSRAYFPGHIVGRTRDGERITVGIRDHSLHYVLAGDAISVDAYVLDQGSTGIDAVGVDLLHVAPRT